MNDDYFDKGLAKRKAVLGDEYVEKNLAAADDFNREFQEVMTAWAWGFGWGDETIDMKTRSMMNLAMLAGLGKMNEWKIHCRGALTNGVTKEEILEAASVAVMMARPNSPYSTEPTKAGIQRARRKALWVSAWLWAARSSETSSSQMSEMWKRVKTPSGVGFHMMPSVTVCDSSDCLPLAGHVPSATRSSTVRRSRPRQTRVAASKVSCSSATSPLTPAFGSRRAVMAPRN